MRAMHVLLYYGPVEAFISVSIENFCCYESFPIKVIVVLMFAVKMEGKNSDQKTNTPLSKHSETEQGRRSKINERFQTLRDLIPENDQKRDKASLLLEYIQFLKEKIELYEGPFIPIGWSPEPSIAIHTPLAILLVKS